MTTKGQAIISIPDGIAKILGFVVGYVFSSEVISGMTFLFGYVRSQTPTLFDLLASYDTRVATILLALLVIFLLGIIMRFRLLSFAIWILYGALFGMVLPLILPYISDRLQSSGYSIPDFIQKILNYFGGVSNGNNTTA